MDASSPAPSKGAVSFSRSHSITGRLLGPLYFLDLSVYWFAVSFLWSGLITIVIQGLVAQIDPTRKDLLLGATLAAGALISTIVSYYAGAHSDGARLKLARTWGKRRPYLLIGTLATIPCLLFLPSAKTLLALMLVVCAIQFWVNLATAPYQALIPDLVPKDKQGAASSWMGLSALLGTSVGLVVYNILFSRPNGLMSIMLLVSLLMLLTGGWTLWRVQEVPAPDPDSAQVLAERSRHRAFSWGDAWRENPSFFWLIGSRFFINLGFYTASEFLLYYVTDTLRAPKPGEVAARFFLISTVAGLIGNFPAGWAADRISKKAVIWVSLLITGVAAGVFLAASSIEVASKAAWIFGAGYGAFLAVDWALATNLLPPRDQARWMGIWHGAFTVPQVIAPALGGLVAYSVNQAYGKGVGYRATLALVLLYLVIGAIMVIPIRERTRDELEAESRAVEAA